MGLTPVVGCIYSEDMTTTTRPITFTAPVARQTWSKTRRFDAGTRVHVRTRRDGRVTLTIPGTLWEITTTANAVA